MWIRFLGLICLYFGNRAFLSFPFPSDSFSSTPFLLVTILPRRCSPGLIRLCHKVSVLFFYLICACPALPGICRLILSHCVPPECLGELTNAIWRELAAWPSQLRYNPHGVMVL
ncbi:hypothetical protein GQ55_8G046600 [Panicum hallii var. hallii]|uniref:Uncharacterized protein n=1 Tax=Panicum hallii var. hallii TaxID=1504633 RepID=A0A2T7CL00_9POAL|nr:hypothetical protein GQ55_8G046600 [Panicum hallii var. hallii]